MAHNPPFDTLQVVTFTAFAQLVIAAGGSVLAVWLRRLRGYQQEILHNQRHISGRLNDQDIRIMRTAIASFVCPTCAVRLFSNGRCECCNTTWSLTHDPELGLAYGWSGGHNCEHGEALDAVRRRETADVP